MSQITSAQRTAAYDVAVIIGLAVFLSLLAGWLGLDMSIAASIGDSGRSGAREWGNLMSRYTFVVAAICLLWLAVPSLRRRDPTTSRCAGVFVMTLLIAVMGFILNLKIELDRPRPKEIVAFGGKYEFRGPFGDEACRCKSFPSSAAGFGYLIATPFFVLRRQRRLTAYAFLLVGLGWGSYLGYAKMLARMHWFTDIVWSAAFVLSTAAVLSQVSVGWQGDESERCRDEVDAGDELDAGAASGNPA